MSGGFSRQYVTRLIPIFLLLSTLAGCSVLFGPKPAPEAEQPAAPPEEAASEAEASASATEAASAPAVEQKHEAAEAKRPPPKKPVYRPPQRAREPVAPPAPPPPPPPPLIVTRLLSQEQTRGLLDTKVQRPDGKIIGRAIDMFADASGKPQSMLVNLAGFMGVGDRKVRFPWNAFRFGPAQRRTPITLDIGPNESPAAEESRSRAKDKRAANKASGARELLLPVIDATVERHNGERVGRVIDVLIDGNAQPQAAVLDVGNLISHDRRSIAADWSALHFVTKDDEIELQMDLSDAQIEAAPPYSADQPVRAVTPAPPAPPHTTGQAGPTAPGSSSPGLASAARPQR
ncbi:PRC-barrel domain containing protein [Trinickia terrae]|uniref:PRC-barrel domain containing protein n=1 Tax=Trinickia terrae TaxID=2571161 RepID=A0A4U1I9F0_9BURK|nr:PRC-barrel domain-containing protein [Trinickia terrae]TKC90102.1 PRC-barrel domain containing protein [Trinickia terrae]